uniref:WH2 domain-containing protein n=1 Tax=Panagrolaimus superbus TaxID=310955 RepID=A0A914YTF5_9BILA
MHVLSDLDTLNVDENERKHIEEVISKAEQRESPFVIKTSVDERRMTTSPFDDRFAVATETFRWPLPEVSVQSPIRSSADIFPIRRVLERIDSQSEVSSEHPATPHSDFTPSEGNVSNLNLFETNCDSSVNNNRRNSLSPSLLFGNQISKISPLASPSSFQGSRRLSAPITYGAIYSPFSPDKNINEVSEEISPVENDVVEITEVNVSLDKIELTLEELEHIRKVNEMAELAMEEPPMLITSPLSVKSTEKNHNKTSVFGSLNLSKVTSTLQKINSATTAVYSTFDAMKENPKTQIIQKTINEVMPAEKVDIFIDQVPQMQNKDMPLTDEEIEHINRIAALAEQESVNYSSKAVKNNETQPILTKEELEHIERITKMADFEMQNPSNSERTTSILIVPQNDLTDPKIETSSKTLSLENNDAFTDSRDLVKNNGGIKIIEEEAGNTNDQDHDAKTDMIKMKLKKETESSEKADLEKHKTNVVDTASKLSSFGFGTFKKAKQILSKTAEQVSDTFQQKLSDDENVRHFVDNTDQILNSNSILNETDIVEEEILQPTNVEFWSESVSHDDNNVFILQNASINSAFSLEKTDQAFDTSNSEPLVTTISDYDMANDTGETVRTFQWYEQQLSQMNKSLDEDFGMLPELEKYEHNGVSLLPSPSIEGHKQALTNYTTQSHVLKNEWEERHLEATGVEEKINELAAAEVNCALQAATEEILGAFKRQPLQQQLPQQIALGEKYSGDEVKEKEEEEEEKEEKSSSFTEPLPSKPAVDATTFQVENKPESHAIVSSKCDEIDISISNQSNIQKIEKKEFTMFGSKSKSGGFGGFGGLSKFASNALQNAKQAGEQIGAKAAQAAQAASTGDLTQVGKVLQQPQNLQTKPPTRSQSSFIPELNTHDIPPGLENLSQEERDKIMAVMACAEIDAGPMLPSKPIATPVIEHKPSQPPVVIPSVKSSSSLNLSEVSNIVPVSSIPTPSIEELGLSHLTPAEQEQILSVMRNAEMQDMSNTSMPIQPLLSPNKPAAKAHSLQVLLLRKKKAHIRLKSGFLSHEA